jgi:hypothetical protein
MSEQLVPTFSGTLKRAMMTKDFILDEIRRTAADNGGKPLGQNRFRSETGIKEYDWRAHWARWGDALVEAGFTPNQLQAAIDKEELVKRYVGLATELGHLPVDGEIRLKRRSDHEFPNSQTFLNRFGNKRELVRAVGEYCRTIAGFNSVAEWCDEYLSREVRAVPSNESHGPSDDGSFGSVYLARLGRYYKIGKSNAAGRREYELSLQLPEKLKMVHVITTDDPGGIEAYWHKRFEGKRTNGEWFELDREDVSAFRRRKFM